MAGSDPYSGIDNLEALEEAVNYQRFLGELIDELGRMAGPGATLVDFGAGMGTYARQARSLHYDVLCVEIDPALRSRLGSDGFPTTTLGELPDRSQRSVYSFNVLEHIEDDAGALAELFRVMSPGGNLLLYVPAFPCLYSSMDRHVGHVRRYRRAELVRRAAGAGFEVDRCMYADSLGFAAALAYRVLFRHATGVLDGSSVRRYDRLVFPLSTRLDPLAHRWFGKNLVLFAHRGGEVPSAGRSARDDAISPASPGRLNGPG